MASGVFLHHADGIQTDPWMFQASSVFSLSLKGISKGLPVRIPNIQVIRGRTSVIEDSGRTGFCAFQDH